MLTVDEYLTDRFLPGVKLRVRESTHRGYEQACRLHIVPHLGQAKLAKLDANNALEPPKAARARTPLGSC